MDSHYRIAPAGERDCAEQREPAATAGRSRHTNRAERNLTQLAESTLGRRPLEPISRGGPRWRFLRGFLKHPSMVASVVPSSKSLIDRVLGPVDWDECRLFVEYGPGVGTITRHVLDRLPTGGTLLAIDTNPEFIAYLDSEFADPRLLTVTGSAADIRPIMARHGFGAADFVLSGLPFSKLPGGAGDRIAEETAKALRPGGAFIVYQFSPKVRGHIAPHFARIDNGFEWRNIPPATIFWAWKGVTRED